jgi:hypothetical protein
MTAQRVAAEVSLSNASLLEALGIYSLAEGIKLGPLGGMLTDHGDLPGITVEINGETYAGIIDSTATGSGNTTQVYLFVSTGEDGQSCYVSAERRRKANGDGLTAFVAKQYYVVGSWANPTRQQLDAAFE